MKIIQRSSHLRGCGSSRKELIMAVKEVWLSGKPCVYGDSFFEEGEDECKKLSSAVYMSQMHMGYSLLVIRNCVYIASLLYFYCIYNCNTLKKHSLSWKLSTLSTLIWKKGEKQWRSWTCQNCFLLFSMSSGFESFAAVSRGFRWWRNQPPFQTKRLQVPSKTHRISYEKSLGVYSSHWHLLQKMVQGLKL